MTALEPAEMRLAEMRLDEAVTWFLSAWPYEGPRMPTADTVRTYRQQLNWLFDFAVSRDAVIVRQIDAGLLRAAIQDLVNPSKERPTCFRGGEATARSLTAATRCMLRWLSRQGVSVADIEHVRPPKPPERIQPRLQPDEFRRLESAVLHQLVEPNRSKPKIRVARDVALLYLLADTGLRASEVCTMTVADIDFETARITVIHGKGRKQRRLSILDPTHPKGGETLRLLGEWIEVRESVAAAREHPLLWINMYGGPLTRGTLRGLLADLSTAAGLDGNRPCHAFRRGHFTEQYRAQPEAVDILSARMGWSPKSPQMVTTYTRGAQLALSEEVAVPSMATRWHQGQGAAVAGFVGRAAPPFPARPMAATQTVRSLRQQQRRPAGVARDGTLERLVQVIGRDPAMRERLLAALLSEVDS